VTAVTDTPVATDRRQVVAALSGLMMGMFVAILASTVVANALPRVVADLGGSQSSYTWVVTTELLAMTATVPLWGKLSDCTTRSCSCSCRSRCSWSARSSPGSPVTSAC
jgi:MFS family permease